MIGKIVTTRPDRGYGFLVGADQIDRFFHMSQVHGDVDFHSMRIGDEVWFDPADSPKGACAHNVEVLPPAQ